MDSADLARVSSWRQARELAEADGWTLAATGDWSWLYRSPEGDRAWRITPFDPAFRAFVKLCLGEPNRHLPRAEAVFDHRDGGYSVIMEWLDPVGEDRAKRWLEAFEQAEEGEVAEVRRALLEAADEIDTPLFAGLDENPTNVLQRPSDGTIVFTDAFWINGPVLFEMIEQQPERALAYFSADDLEHWAYLPCMDTAGTSMILRAIGRSAQTKEGRL